jgi:hypothetical protein
MSAFRTSARHYGKSRPESTQKYALVRKSLHQEAWKAPGLSGGLTGKQKPRGPGGTGVSPEKNSGEAVRPGVSPENKNQGTANPCRDQFFLFTMSKSSHRQRRRIKNKYRTLYGFRQGVSLVRGQNVGFWEQREPKSPSSRMSANSQKRTLGHQKVPGGTRIPRR